MKANKIRIILPACLLVIAFIGFVCNISVGNFSAFGWEDIMLICPLGALATMLAAKTLIPRALISLVIAIAFILVLGRAFCGWLCPVPLVSKLRNAFSKSPAKTDESMSARRDSKDALTESEKKTLSDAMSGCSACASIGSKRGSKLDSRHFVLVAGLLSTLIFGFPVFCIVCPIGLTFGTIFLFVNLFGAGDVSWMTVVFPVILLAETVFFRKWCHMLCPLGAAMSLISKGNKTFVPSAERALCLETGRDYTCGKCAAACPEGIDPRHAERSQASMNECTKCRACVESCPANAITMPFAAARNAENAEV